MESTVGYVDCCYQTECQVQGKEEEEATGCSVGVHGLKGWYGGGELVVPSEKVSDLRGLKPG